MRSVLYDYPFWGPANAGPARDFAQPVEPKAIQLIGIEADAVRLRVPQEIQYQSAYLPDWQWNPIIVPTPQAPVQVPEGFVRATSLFNYATATLEAASVPQSSATLGNAGQRNTGNG